MGTILSWIPIAFLLYLCIPMGQCCPVSPQCTCSSDRNEAIVCDVARYGQPQFSGDRASAPYQTVVIIGSKELSDHLFYGLYVRGVRLSGLSLISIPCHVFSGVEPDLVRVDISDNVLVSVPTCTFIHLNNVAFLYMNKNRISSLPDSSFEGLRSLYHLDLGKNLIRSLHPDCWNGLDSLRLLNLSQNALLDIGQESFKGLFRLETLILSGNGIVRIHDDAFESVRLLQELDLSNNKLSLVTFRYLRSLKRINLRKNKIERLIENAYKDCTELEELDVSFNILRTVPAFVMTLPSLKRLIVTNNYISTLDLYGQIPPRNPLAILDFSDNAITSVLNAYCVADRTFEFRLRNNHLTTFPNLTVLAGTAGNSSVLIDLSMNSLLRPPSIRYILDKTEGTMVSLNLSHNRLYTLEYLQPQFHSQVPMSVKNTRMRYDLSYNKLTTIPNCSFFLRHNIELLDLSSNLIHELPKGGCIASSVRQLVLNDNLITRLGRIYFGGIQKDVPILQRVSLARNKLTQVSSGAFQGLSSLGSIDLRTNALESVPKSAVSLMSLEDLLLQGNPLHCDCIHDNITNLAANINSALDNVRCVNPPDKRGFLAKCFVRSCDLDVMAKACIDDQFVGLDVSVRHLGEGVSISWVLYGPGNSSSIRLNVTEGNSDIPVFINLIDPKITTFSFVNMKPGLIYSVCVEALNPSGVSLTSRCFSGLKLVEKNSITNISKPVSNHAIWLTVVCCVLVVLLLVLIVYICIRKHKSKPLLSYKRNNRSNGLTKGSFKWRLIKCLEFCRFGQGDEDLNNAVVMSDLLLNENFQTTQHPSPQHGFNSSTTSCHVGSSEQPPLPPRNSSLSETSRNIEEQAMSIEVDKCPETGKSTKGITPHAPRSNVYEKNFHLQVCLEKGASCSPYHSSEENIYEDTVPLEEALLTTKPRNNKHLKQIIPPERQVDKSCTGYECPVIRQRSTEEKSDRSDTNVKDEDGHGIPPNSNATTAFDTKNPMPYVTNPTYSKLNSTNPCNETKELVDGSSDGKDQTEETV